MGRGFDPHWTHRPTAIPVFLGVLLIFGILEKLIFLAITVAVTVGLVLLFRFIVQFVSKRIINKTRTQETPLSFCFLQSAQGRELQR